MTDNSANNWPVVEKIALRGESGIPIGHRLNYGTFIGINKNGLWLFGDTSFQNQKPGNRRRRAEEVEDFFQKGKTSPIVALFLTEDKARECFSVENLVRVDSRWRTETEEVLKAIGNDHPVFVPSDGHFGLFSA